MTEKHILAVKLLETGCGTHKYDVKYTGEWKDEDLITAIDNQAYHNPTAEDLQISHFGGYVEPVYTKEDVNRAIVGVYYD